MNRHAITVIGGNNIDIIATSHTQIVYGDSNPGKIRTSLGGVGRNIAENLTRLRQNVRLITAFGDDEFSYLVKNQAQRIQMDISESVNVSGIGNSMYLCVNDPSGEMMVGISDMDVCAAITPAFLATKMPLLNASEAVVVDANLSEESIAYLAETCTAPMYAEAVSVKKAGRFASHLSMFTGVKANRIEMELLSGMRIGDREEALKAIGHLHSIGVSRVFLTMGKEGACASDGVEAHFEHTARYKPVNTTGCGDAFYASAICAALDGENCLDVLRTGLSGAAVCALSETAVAENMSPEALLPYLEQFQEG
ncbi:MAG: PfkB family carbohydrate kinase [Eubacteriales bacterium]|nr:PfkB family carbohydrate kinase [Eubacteriales bacterium]